MSQYFLVASATAKRRTKHAQSHTFIVCLSRSSNTYVVCYGCRVLGDVGPEAEYCTRKTTIMNDLAESYGTLTDK